MTTIESAQAEHRRAAFFTYGNEVPRRACPECGVRFFTAVGLEEHVRAGDHGTTVVRSWVTGGVSPAGLIALQEAGRKVAALNNSRRRSCHGCGHVSTPSGIALHQQGSGHVGWTEVPQ